MKPMYVAIFVLAAVGASIAIGLPFAFYTIEEAINKP